MACQTLTADLLVACDGQNSPSRQLLGIGNCDYHQVGVVGVVMTDKPHHHQAIERFNKMGAVAVLPFWWMRLISVKGMDDKPSKATAICGVGVPKRRRTALFG
ncbi:MAG: FAD-dependent monooxygenase [Moraxella sp.]